MHIRIQRFEAFFIISLSLILECMHQAKKKSITKALVTIFEHSRSKKNQFEMLNENSI